MHRHVGAVERGELFRQRTEVAWLDPAPVDDALDLDAAVGEVVDGAAVAHVAVDAGGTVAFKGLDDVRSILQAAFERHTLLTAQHHLDRLVVLAAPPWPVVAVKPALAQVAGAGVLLDQVWPLSAVGHVLGEVAAGLDDERTQEQPDFEALRVMLVNLATTLTLT